MAKSSTKLTAQEIHRQLKTMHSADEVKAFIKGEPGKIAMRLAEDRLYEIQQAQGASPMQIDDSITNPNGSEPKVINTGQGDQPLDKTTRPATKKEAKEIRDAAAANRPFQPEPPTIFGKAETPREQKIAAALIQEFAVLVNKNIAKIMQSYDEAITLHDDEKKFKYKIPVSCSITGDDPLNYTIDVKAAWTFKASDEMTTQVRLADDLVDMMGKGKAEVVAGGDGDLPFAEASE
jgi:hypothetical protein